MESKGKFIGEVGRSCANQRSLEGWVLKTWSNLMRPCLQSRCGGYCTIKTLCFIRCLKLNTSLLERCLMPKSLSDHVPDRVY